MGVLSNYFKPNFLGLLKFLNSMNWFIVFFSLINLSVCIYEDQIGKFDWRQSYVGRIKFAQFDTVSTAKKIIVATEENVLAALHLKTGQVVWRHVFETASTGNIQLLHVSDKVVTVTGANPYLVRGWESTSGVLLFEWSLNLQNDEQADFSEWWVHNNMLVHMLPVFGSHLEVTMYNLVTGQNRGATSKLPALWTNDGCVLTPPYYTCVSGQVPGRSLIALDLESQAAVMISNPLRKYVADSSEGSLRLLDGPSAAPGFVIDEQIVVLVRDGKFEEVKVPVINSASVSLVDSSTGPLLLQIWSDEDKGFTLTAHDVEGGVVSDVGAVGAVLRAPGAGIAAAVCSRAGRERACRVLMTAEDDAVHLVAQDGRVVWSREEALANVVAAEFVDLPVSDLDAAIESEFDLKEGSIWASFTRRVATQWQQVRSLLVSLSGPGGDDEPGADGASATPLVRDYFNLHKIIVILTDVGKIFGIDNLTGEVVWSRFEPTLEPRGAALLPRRAANRPPHDPVLTVVGRHAETGNGLVINLNPLRGNLVAEGILHLDTKLLQCALLPKADNDKLYGLVLLDIQENVQVLPVSAGPLVENLFMYVAVRETARVRGYAIKYDGTTVQALQTWSLNLGGGHPSILAATARRARTERPHSAGRVLGDRSVLYKHTNPNLVLFVTQGADTVHKDVVTATVVDCASGAVVAAALHRRARAAPLAVHADNFFAYVYYNDKHRRPEIATLEVYEGPVRWLPAGAPFSSLAGARAPAVERAAFVLPAAPAALAATNTERSLTDKHVLLALSTGAIVELPWAYLEPRRPISPTAEQREEGLIPYAPELPLPSEAVVTYNQTLHRITQIHTAPSGLESTCLVLATGLDLFYTRVAPSKTFDLLKDDFDYYLITIVLTALVVATYSTKYFASRKMLRMAWK